MIFPNTLWNNACQNLPTVRCLNQVTECQNLKIRSHSFLLSLYIISRECVHKSAKHNRDQTTFWRASILSWAPPFPPEMIAPAWPILRPGGALSPAMKDTTGFAFGPWKNTLLNINLKQLEHSSGGASYSSVSWKVDSWHNRSQLLCKQSQPEKLEVSCWHYTIPKVLLRLLLSQKQFESRV